MRLVTTKGIVIIFALFFTAFGFFLSQYMFTFDGGFFSIPFKPQTVRLTKDVEIICSGKNFIIPEDSELILRGEYDTHREYYLVI